MQFKVLAHVRMFFALALVAGFVALTLSLSPGVASASSPRSGELHMTKECTQYTGAAGSFCTITSSNLGAIAVGSKVVYTSAFGTLSPTALDSDVVLVVGPANTVFGHVHFDSATGTGFGTFSGGTGQFTHFHASFTIAPPAPAQVNWHFDGTYSFSPPN